MGHDGDGCRLHCTPNLPRLQLWYPSPEAHPWERQGVPMEPHTLNQSRLMGGASQTQAPAMLQGCNLGNSGRTQA